MKYTLISILILFNCINAWGDSLFTQIQIEITTDKHLYIEGEPIFVTVNVANHSNTPLMFDIHDNVLFIHNQSNKRYFANMESDSYYIENLLPNATYKRRIELTNLYGELALDNVFFNFFPAGEYQVQIRYKDRRKDIKANSNILKFIVVKPNREQQYIFAEFLNAKKLSENRYRKNDQRILYRRLTQEYPRSIYTPVIYYHLILSYQFTKTSDAKNREYFDVCNRMIHEFPDHPYALRAINGITKYFRLNNDRSGAEKYLEKLRDENLHPQINDHITNKALPRVRDKSNKYW